MNRGKGIESGAAKRHFSGGRDDRSRAPLTDPMKKTILRQFTRMQNSLAKRFCWREHLAEAQSELARLRRELPTDEMMMAIPLLFKGKGYYQTLKLKQNMVELSGLVREVRREPLRRVCEIGTFKGGTLFIWCQLAEPDAHIISVDLPGGQFGGGYSEKSLPFFQSFRKGDQRLDCIRGSSHDVEIREEFESKLGGEELDFLFIDGDHSYEGVKMDFEHYSKFVRKGGLIAFHDIHHRPNQPDIEVHKLWQELKSDYRHKEFVETDSDRRAIGLGLLYKD